MDKDVPRCLYTHNRIRYNMRIALVHNKIRDYREPLFSILNDKFNISYFIFDEEISPQSYSFDVSQVSKFDLLYKIINNDFDVVILPEYQYRESWIAGLGAKINGSKIIAWSEVWDWPHSAMHERALNRLLSTGMNYLTDCFIVPGKKSENYLEAIPLMPTREIFQAPNAPNIKPKNGDYESIDDKKQILFLGQVVERKGVHDVIQSLNYVDTDHEIELIIAGVGDPDYIETLERISDSRVKFLGWVPDESVMSLYSSADVYVLPSLQDPYPLSVVEAMSEGTPTIISEGVGEAGDLVRDGVSGEVVATKSPEEIGKAISRIINYKRYSDRLSENAKEVIQQRVSHEYMARTFKWAIQYCSAKNLITEDNK